MLVHIVGKALKCFVPKKKINSEEDLLLYCEFSRRDYNECEWSF